MTIKQMSLLSCACIATVIQTNAMQQKPIAYAVRTEKNLVNNPAIVAIEKIERPIQPIARPFAIKTTKQPMQPQQPIQPKPQQYDLFSQQPECFTGFNKSIQTCASTYALRSQGDLINELENTPPHQRWSMFMMPKSVQIEVTYRPASCYSINPQDFLRLT